MSNYWHEEAMRNLNMARKWKARMTDGMMFNEMHQCAYHVAAYVARARMTNRLGIPLRTPQYPTYTGPIRGPGPDTGTSKDDAILQHTGKEAPNAPPNHRVK